MFMSPVIHFPDLPHVTIGIQRIGFSYQYHFHALSARRTSIAMMIELDLNTNDSEALLRHCTGCQPNSGDAHEDSRLADALQTLAFAIKDSMKAKHPLDQSAGMTDPKLLEAAVSLFGDEALACRWLSRPVRAVGGKAPSDVDVEAALALVTRLEHGFLA
jgi:hypothetical protein